MDKAKLAEWFMSLVMARPLAAAVIGDLLEIGATRSHGWFWSNVIRTWLATVWSDAKAEPRFVLGMAALGSLVGWGVTLVAQFAFLFSDRMVSRLVLPHFSLHAGPSLVFGQVQMLTTVFAGAFYAGQWITRYSLGREMAVCCAMALVDPVVSLVLGVLFWLFLSVSHGFIGIGVAPLTVGNSAWFIFPMVPYFLGAVWARKRAQATRAI